MFGVWARPSEVLAAQLQFAQLIRRGVCGDLRAVPALSVLLVWRGGLHVFENPWQKH